MHAPWTALWRRAAPLNLGQQEDAAEKYTNGGEPFEEWPLVQALRVPVLSAARRAGGRLYLECIVVREPTIDTDRGSPIEPREESQLLEMIGEAIRA